MSPVVYVQEFLGFMPGVKQLDHEAWTFEDNAELFSKVVLWIHMPTNNVWDPIIHPLSNVLIVISWTSIEWHLIVVLTCMSSISNHLFICFFFKFIYSFWERERKRVSGVGEEREGERESQGGSTEPDAGLNPMNQEITTWAEIKSQTLNRMSHPGAPLHMFIRYTCFLFCETLAHSFCPFFYWLFVLFLLICRGSSYVLCCMYYEYSWIPSSL